MRVEWTFRPPLSETVFAFLWDVEFEDGTRIGDTEYRRATSADSETGEICYLVLNEKGDVYPDYENRCAANDVIRKPFHFVFCPDDKNICWAFDHVCHGIESQVVRHRLAKYLPALHEAGANIIGHPTQEQWDSLRNYIAEFAPGVLKALKSGKN